MRLTSLRLTSLTFQAPRSVCHLALSWAVLVSCVLASCTSRSAVPPLPEPSRPALRTEYGVASWYGRERQGQRTASGERYDSERLTAAHRTALFGIYALVTNLANGRKVWVRINDRGPALTERVLDLSYAAARQLDMVRAGLARVKIEFFAERPGGG